MHELDKRYWGAYYFAYLKPHHFYPIASKKKNYHKIIFKIEWKNLSYTFRHHLISKPTFLYWLSRSGKLHAIFSPDVVFRKRYIHQTKIAHSRNNFSFFKYLNICQKFDFILLSKLVFSKYISLFTQSFKIISLKSYIFIQTPTDLDPPMRV